MSAGHSQSHGHGNPDEHGTVFQRIWIPFFILLGITALEFLIAFTMGAGIARTLIFLLLTIVKAFYIVAYFMHLKFERFTLWYSLGVPTLLIVYLVVLLLLEGDYINKMVARFG